MILVGAGLTMLAFVLYPQAAAVTPWISARYLVGLLIAVPAILFPLWEKKGHIIKSLRDLVRYAPVLLAVVVALLGTIEIFSTQLPLAQASSASQQALINRLVQMGATHIYTDYDDCNRLAFLSNERIVCAVLDDGLQPGLDRYFPYRAQVARAPHPFYLFPVGSVQAFLIEQKAAQQHITYTKFVMGSYVVYDPAQRIAA